MFSKIAFAAVLFVQLAFTAAQFPSEGIFAIQEANGPQGNDYGLCYQPGDVYTNLEIRPCPLHIEGTWAVEGGQFNDGGSIIRFLNNGACEGTGCFVNRDSLQEIPETLGLRVGHRDEQFVLRHVPWQGANPNDPNQLFFIVEVPGTNSVWTVEEIGQKKLIVLAPIREGQRQAAQVFRFVRIIVD